MGIDSLTLSPTTFFRQDSKPPSAADGATWLTNSDGSGNDTSSRYVYNAEADQWELNSAVGPSEPTDGTMVAGATWRDTTNGTATQYDGNSFQNLGNSQITPSGYTDVTSNRSEGTTYTNTTGEALEVVVQAVQSNETQDLLRAYLQVDGKVIDYNRIRDAQSGEYQTARAIVPNGSTYYANIAPSVNLWFEQKLTLG